MYLHFCCKCDERKGLEVEGSLDGRVVYCEMTKIRVKWEKKEVRSCLPFNIVSNSMHVVVVAWEMVVYSICENMMV